MAFNGSGVFLRVMNWQNDANSNIKIRADRHDQEDNNLAAGLTQCITRDGQSTVTANLPMSGYRHKNVSDGQSRNEYATVGQIQDNAVTTSVISGSANTYSMSPSVAVTSYATGQMFWGKINVTNTGSSTLNVSGLGAKSIKSFGTNDVVSGELVAGKLYGFYYDGTNFVIVSSSQFTDSGLNIVGSSDATKKVNFDVDGLTTATTRTLTVPDRSGSLVVSDVSDLVPSGSTIMTFATTAPSGWLICDGSAVSRTTYATLFAAIGISCGSGDGSTTFNIPDMRGYTPRGLDGTANRDPDKTTRTAMATGGNTGNNIGSVQQDTLQNITGKIGGLSNSATTAVGAFAYESFYSGNGQNTQGNYSFTFDASRVARTSTETRMKNVNVNFIIKI